MERSRFGSPTDVAKFLSSLVDSSAISGRFFVLIDDIREIDDRAIHPVLKRMLSANVRFVAVGDSFRRVGVSNPLLIALRAARASLHLQPTPREIAEITQSRSSIRPGVEMPPGRGVLLLNRSPVVVQTYLC